MTRGDDMTYQVGRRALCFTRECLVFLSRFGGADGSIALICLRSLAAPMSPRGMVHSKDSMSGSDDEGGEEQR